MTVPTKSPFKAAVSASVTTVSSANYTVTDTDGFDTILVSTGGSDRTITLPAVAANSGRTLLIKKTDAGAGKVTVTPNGGTIDGISTFTLTAQYSKLSIVSDGTNWFIQQATGAAKCFAYRSGAQSIATSADVVVQLNATLFDTNNNFNTGTFRFVASREGYYQVSAQVFMSEEATLNTYYSLQVYRSGTLVLNAYQTYNETGAQAASNSVSTSGLVFLNVSDYLDLHTVHVSSGSKNLGAGASATFLSILEILDK